MARRVKRSPDKLWRNIRFKVVFKSGCGLYVTVGGQRSVVNDSAEYFPKASIEMIREGVSTWKHGKLVERIEFLAFEDTSNVWPQDGGHEWRRDSPMLTACPSDRATWYKCKHCKATAKRVGGPDIPIVRCTGEKVCPFWRRKARA